MTISKTQGYVVRSMGGNIVIPKQSIYEQKAVTIATEKPPHQVGDKCLMSDGRVFHYAENGTAAALVAGHILQNAATIANHWNMVGAVTAIGETKISLTPTTASITANQYANGYLWVNAGTGLGQFYKIKNHPAITLAVAGYFYLYDPLVVALDATSRITIMPSPWKGVIDMPTSITGMPVGVAPIAVSQSTSTIHYFFWCQTWGPCCVLAGGTQVITTPQMTVGHDAGGVIVEAAHGIPTVGWLYNGLQVTDAEYAGCFLRICP